MRQLIKTLIFVALAVSCTREIVPEPAIDSLVRRYNLSFVESTKTELSGSGSTRQVKWNAGDEIYYYTEPGQSSSAFVAANKEGSNAYLTIPCGRSDDFINAVYGAFWIGPASTKDTMYISHSPVKNQQNYRTFSQAHLCAAFSDNIENPNLIFHNIAAIFKFTSSRNLSKVIFYGNKNEVITGGDDGSLRLSYSNGSISSVPVSVGGTSVTILTKHMGIETDFYFSVIPVLFEEGITIECYDFNNKLIAIKKTYNAINTLSFDGTVRVLNLGHVQDWIDSYQPTAVDFGLSVKWASFNVGATCPTDFGNYFAWAETESKSVYDWSTYKWCNDNYGNRFTKYCTKGTYWYQWDKSNPVDNKVIFDLEDDPSYIKYGSNWRTPTIDEWQELIDNSTWTPFYINKNYYVGMIVRSNIPGYLEQSIFLPAAGYRTNVDYNQCGSFGYYYSASLDSNLPSAAWGISFSIYKNEAYIKHFGRRYGLIIRPVFDPKN